MRRIIPILLIIMTFSVFCAAADDTEIQVVSDLLGRFGKMTDGLDKLRCRPANGRSIFGFYLKEGTTRIQYFFESDNEYIVLLSTLHPVECKIEHGRDGRLLADQKGSRIYMKYTANRVQHSEITVTSQHGGDPAIMLIMCRDRYSLPLPFEDILAMSREMADSSACRGKLLTNKTDYFLIGGTFASNAFDKYEIAEGLVSGLRFAVGHSKTIDEVALELQRGSGIANSVIGHGVQSIDTKTTRQARYSVIYRNDSPDVFEHGIMMMAVFDR